MAAITMTTGLVQYTALVTGEAVGVEAIGGRGCKGWDCRGRGCWVVVQCMG